MAPGELVVHGPMTPGAHWTRWPGWRSDLLVTVVLAGLLVPLTVSGLQGEALPAASRVGLPLVLLGLHLSVLGRRRLPVPAFVLASAAMLAVLALPDAHAAAGSAVPYVPVPLLLVPSTLLYAFMLVSLSAAVTRRESLLALASALVGVLLATWRLREVTRGVLPSAGWALLVVGLVLAGSATTAWLVGRLLRARDDARRMDREHLVALARVDERAAIAREMHDIVAHSLAVIVRQAEAGSYVADSDPVTARSTLDVVASTGRQALSEMRGVLGALRADPPSTRDAVDAGDDLDTLPERLTGLVDKARAAGLQVRLSGTGEPYALPTQVGTAAYRAVQEALTNCLKHAGPGARAEVWLVWSASAVQVGVVDDGPVAPHVAVPGAGVGLVGLAERVAAVGGELSCGPVAAGFAVRVSLPRSGCAERTARGSG